MYFMNNLSPFWVHTQIYKHTCTCIPKCTTVVITAWNMSIAALSTDQYRNAPILMASCMTMCV